MALTTPDKAPVALSAPERSALIVTQPKHLENILAAIADLEKISEVSGEDKSGDWSGASGGTQQGDDAAASGGSSISPRDQAIAKIPGAPVMQRELQSHIESEVHRLRRQAARLTRLHRPGAAFELNKLYAKIRRLNVLLIDLFDASVDVLKRLFIRVFIDRQPIL